MQKTTVDECNLLTVSQLIVIKVHLIRALRPTMTESGILSCTFYLPLWFIIVYFSTLDQKLPIFKTWNYTAFSLSPPPHPLTFEQIKRASKQDCTIIRCDFSCIVKCNHLPEKFDWGLIQSSLVQTSVEWYFIFKIMFIDTIMRVVQSRGLYLDLIPKWRPVNV